MRNHKKTSFLGTIRNVIRTILQRIQGRRPQHILSLEGRSVQRTSAFLTGLLKKRGVQLVLIMVVLAVVSYQVGRSQRPTGSVSQQKTSSQVYSKVIHVDQSVELPVAGGKEKETVLVTFTTAEKTNQVVVDDKVGRVAERQEGGVAHAQKRAVQRNVAAPKLSCSSAQAMLLRAMRS